MTEIVSGFGERRSEKRVTYTAILGFKELHGRKIPSFPPKPNATAANLSLTGICFISRQCPNSELLVLYLPDGARAVARVVTIMHAEDPTLHRIHCQVLKWLAKGEKTVEIPEVAAESSTQ